MIQQFVIPCGVPWSTALTLKDSEGNLLDLTGYSFSGFFQVLGQSGQLQYQSMVNDPASGMVTFYLNADQTTSEQEGVSTFNMAPTDTPEEVTTLAIADTSFSNTIHSPPAKDLIIKNSGTFYTYYECISDGSPVSLVGYTASCRFRMSQNSLTPIVDHQNFPQCTVGPNDGTVVITLSVQQTPLLNPGEYWYDVYLTNGIDSFILAQGNLIVTT